MSIDSGPAMGEEPAEEPARASASEAANAQPDSDGPVVERELRGPVAVLTMVYRPYNLVGSNLMGELLAGLDWAEQQGARAIVIRSGLRHFCAGADPALLSQRVGTTGEGRMDPVENLKRFETLPIPIVASVHGACLGGGFELALACDFIIAADSAKLGSVEAALGLHPIMGGIQRQVQRAGMHRAKELAMLARRYDPATLERWGLVNRVVAEERLEEVTLAIADELGHGPTVAHAATKLVAHIAVNDGVMAADEAMGAIQQSIWQSEDLKAGLASFRENGPGLAKFDGR
jgi:enoyl-CoA hydratase/carnithine racemase